MLRIHNDVVVVWTPGSFVVGALMSDRMVIVKQPVSIGNLHASTTNVLYL